MRPNSQQMARMRPLRKRPLGKRHLSKRYMGRGHLRKRHLRKRPLGKKPLGKTHLRWNSSPRMATCSGIHPPRTEEAEQEGKI